MCSTLVGHIRPTFRAYREDDQWVSECRELDTASCGDTVDEAFDALLDATLVYLQTLEEIGELAHVLKERNVEVVPGAPEDDIEQVSIPARPNEIVSPHRLAIPVGKA